MKKLIGIIFIGLCLFNPTLDAASNGSMVKKLRKSLSVQPLIKSKRNASKYVLEKELSGDSFQVTFFEEPSEWYCRFSEETYQSIISEFTESDDYDDDVYDDNDDIPYPDIDYATLFPKESRVYFVFDENSRCECLGVFSLQKSQEQVAQSISTFLADYKKYYSDDECEDEHFEFTSLKKDEKGYYTTDLFYSCIDDFEDEEYSEYSWGKIVITHNHLFYLLFDTMETNSQIEDQAEKFLSSFDVN